MQHATCAKGFQIQRGHKAEELDVTIAVNNSMEAKFTMVGGRLLELDDEDDQRDEVSLLTTKMFNGRH